MLQAADYPPPALLAAWRRTRYLAAGAEVRIGRRSRTMDGLLARLGARAGGFVGAENPFGRRAGGARNARAAALLDAAIRRLPRLAAAGVGRGWREEHRLVLAAPARLRVLARRFRQGGIVVVRRGAPARLVILPPR